MPTAPTGRQDKRLYQPPLPWSADPWPEAVPSRRRGGQGWRLDERTRRAGRQGVAAARAALAGAGEPGGRRADAA
ncbi:MAG TPA: hypothetical protein VN796_05920 [Acidimicrobiales bacterium]|nr:hypothetical protein [Acidimicrobiales bacterium]